MPRSALLFALTGLLLFTQTVSSSASLQQPIPDRPGRKYSVTERLQPARLRGVHEDRSRLAAARKAVRLRTGYHDYKAILHAHAEDSQHTGGTRPELLAAAKRTGVRLIMLTDHVRPPRDFMADSWRGLRDGVLFIPGAEAEGFLSYPVRSIKNRKWDSREDYIRLIKEGGGDIFLSHIEERPDWPTEQLDGMEIYNLHADFKEDQMEFIKWMRATASDPDRLASFQKLLAEYPQEIFGVTQDYLSAYLAKWDHDSLTHRVTGVAANDCHHNQVITIKVASPDAIELWLTGDQTPSLKITSAQAPRLTELTRNREPGAIIATLDLDPYERSLSHVTTHILTHKLNEAAVRAALRQAHAYVAHDWLCEATGFAFVAKLRGRKVAVMGDEVKLSSGLQIQVAAPVAGIIRLFRNGEMMQEVKNDSLKYEVTQPGIYRAEVWLKIDDELRPWIYANPIRVGSAK